MTGRTSFPGLRPRVVFKWPGRLCYDLPPMGEATPDDV
jgi:hypothetical protein